MATSSIFDPRPTPYFDQNGELAVGAKAYFYLANTTTPLTVYTDQDLTTPHPWPVIAGSNGTFAPIYMPFEDYRVVIKDKYDVSLFDAPIVPNAAPASSGGGTIVSATQIYQTGDMVFRLRTGAMSGFVRANGRTIGSASSGATEYAGDTAQDLYSFLWENLSDGVAPVSSGRGASASDDWSANKTIIVPSMQGRAPIGLDDMGGAAANVVQVSTTASVTSGVATCPVSSATGLAKGMYVIIDGAAAGTISDISGTTVTLSAAYAGTTNAAATFRASLFSNAQSVGAVGGSQTITQTTAEMPSHKHTLNETPHHHNLGHTNVGYAAGLGPVSDPTAVLRDGATDAATTGITMDNTGSGLPMSNLSPGRLGTWYVKL